MSDSRKLAQIMCDLTRDVVWEFAKEIAHSHGATMMGPLRTRIGSGRRTYHSLDSERGTQSHLINYGHKMVEMKKDYSKVPYVLSGKEIAQKGFYNGDLSYKNLLAHTVIHEVSHAVQTAVGKRHFNEVHNKAFYNLLHEMHEACGQLVVDELEKRAVRQGISLEFDPETYDLDESGNRKNIAFKPDHHEPVAVNIRGSRCLAVVTRPGKLKSEILIYRGRHIGSSFNASNTLMSPLGPDDIKPDPQKDIPKVVAWCPGDKVHFFGPNNAYYEGDIDKVNPKKCVVRITGGNTNDIGGRVNVPKSMLQEGGRNGNERQPKKASNHEFSF